MRPDPKANPVSVSVKDYRAQVGDWQAREPPKNWAYTFDQLGFHLPGSVVLDCGCGPGHCGKFLVERGAAVVGLDREEVCVAGAAQGGGYKGLVCGLVQSLPFRSKAFDLVLLRYVIHHLASTEWLSSLIEVRCVLVRGGALLLETSFRDQRSLHFDHQIYPRLSEATEEWYPERAELISLLRRAGFSSVDEVSSLQRRQPYDTVAEALMRSKQLVERGIGPTAWLQLSSEERAEFHQQRTTQLPLLFGAGPVPREWMSSFVMARR